MLILSELRSLPVSNVGLVSPLNPDPIAALQSSLCIFMHVFISSTDKCLDTFFLSQSLLLFLSWSLSLQKEFLIWADAHSEIPFNHCFKWLNSI